MWPTKSAVSISHKRTLRVVSFRRYKTCFALWSINLEHQEKCAILWAASYLTSRTSACAARDIEYFSKKPERPIVLNIRQLIATGRRTLRESIARQKHWFGCGADPLSLKAAKVVHFPILALLANQSLNRTLCGGPRLAIISFLAKPGPPQSAG